QNPILLIPLQFRFPLAVIFSVAQHAEVLPIPGDASVCIFDREIRIAPRLVLPDEWPFILINNSRCSKFVSDDHLRFVNHQLAAARAMNVLLVIDSLTDLDRLRWLEEVRQAARGIGKMTVVDQFMGLALAEQDDSRRLPGERRIQQFPRQYPAWV